MKIIKKLEIILIITSIILSITYSKLFAATELTEAQRRSAAQDILDKINTEIVYYTGDEDTDRDLLYCDLSDDIAQAKMTKIAADLAQKCKEAGITVDDVMAEWPRMATDTDTAWYIVYSTANSPDTSKLEEQVANPTGTNNKKTELENKILNLYSSKDLSNFTTDELTQLDDLLREYKTDYPYAWNLSTNEIRKTVGDSVDNEVVKRKSEGTVDSNYETTVAETNKEREEELDKVSEASKKKEEYVYEYLEKEQSTEAALGSSTASATHTPDQIIEDGNSFLQAGTGTTTIDGENLTSASVTLYNILLSIGIFLAVAIGVFLGAKFMFSAAEDKAKVKEALIPYIAGCVVIFGAFIIWKVAILLLSDIEQVALTPTDSQYVIAKQIDEK